MPLRRCKTLRHFFPDMTSDKPLKLVLLGDAAVGKTCLLRMWNEKVFSENFVPTVGGAWIIRKDEVDGVTYEFNIWDTAGAERYRALCPLYARGSHAALLVFDMTQRSTFDNLQTWVDFVRREGDIPFVIAGNKDDLVTDDGDHVTSQEAIEFAYMVNSQFYPTSARTGSNVDLVFKQLEIEAVGEFQRKGPSETQPSIPVEGPSEPQESGGCC